MTLPDPHRRPPRAACQTIRRPPRGGDHQGVNQPSRRPLRGLRSRVIENPGMGDRIQRNTQEDSLFQYKAGFSDRRHQFATWRWIIELAIYRELSEERQRRDELQAGGLATGDY